MNARKAIDETMAEYYDTVVDRIVARVEQSIGDVELDELTTAEQRERLDHVLSTGHEPDFTGDKVAENAWTLCIDAAHSMGFEGEHATVLANRACEKMGVKRTANYDALKQLRQRYKSKNNLAAALKALHYGSFAQAVNDLKAGDKDPKEIEQELIWKALSTGVRIRRRR
jgi:hypothetical protein